MAKGVLAVAFDFTNAQADEFHDWYDLEHIPERQRVPGFGLCERWIDIANPKIAVATYDLDSLSVLQSPAYQAIGGDNLSVWSKRMTAKCNRLLRFDGEQINPGTTAAPTAAPTGAPAGANGFLLVSMIIAPEVDADFNAWYDTEHLPALGGVPGVLSARRFKALDGSRRYSALYHMTSTEVMQTPAWKTAATSAWTERMFPHFQDFIRVRARRYSRAI